MGVTQRPIAAASSDRPVADGRCLKAKRIERLVPTHEGSLGHLVVTYLRDLELRGLSRHTVRGRSAQLRYFLVWCEGRTVRRPDDLDREVLDAYRLWVAGCKTREGKPLSPATRHDRVATVLRFVRWAHRTGRLPVDPSAGVELPRCARRLPKTVLTVAEAERVLAIPDTSTVLGLRDRAILELLYSTGLRRQELIDLEASSLDLARGVIAVRLGKGRKDRFVPVSRRAANWMARYLASSRPALLAGRPCSAVFVTTHRGPMSPERMTVLVRRYVDAAALGKRGACHLFRHSVATLMLEGGADLRFVQALLGHADISTTQLYTRVAIRSLQVVHQQTHPGSRPPKPSARHSHQRSSPGPYPAAPRRRGPRRARLER